jgi:predicted GNAT family acetyltransferase
MIHPIIHDLQKECFKTSVDSHDCVLEYRKVTPTLLDFYHTYVPAKLRGRQIAQQLTIFALDYARRNNFKIIPSCSYVAHFISLHPDFQGLVN